MIPASMVLSSKFVSTGVMSTHVESHESTSGVMGTLFVTGWVYWSYCLVSICRWRVLVSFVYVPAYWLMVLTEMRPREG